MNPLPAILSAAVAVTCPDEGELGMSQNWIGWDAAVHGPGPLSEVITAQMGDNVTRELVVRERDKLTVFHNVGVVDAPVQAVGSGVVDAATLPGADAANSGADGILVLRAQDVLLLTQDAGSATFSTTVVSALSSFAGSSSIWVRPSLPGSYYVMARKGNDLLRYEWSASGGYTALSSIDCALTVLDVESVNYDGDGLDVQELAILTTDDVRIYSRTGSPIALLGSVLGGSLAVSRSTLPGDRDLLLVNSAATGSGEQIVACNSAGMSAPMAVLGNCGVLLGLDYDLNGAGDVVRMEDSSFGVGKMWVRVDDGQNPAQPFANLFGDSEDLGSTINLLTDLNAQACYELTGLVVDGAAGDFDDDGDQDFVLMAANPGPIAMKIAGNQLLDAQDYRLDFDSDPWNVIVFDGDEQVTVRYHPAYDMSAMNAETHVRIELWLEHGAGGPMEEVTAARTNYALPLNFPQQFTFSCPVSKLQTDTIRHFVLTPYSKAGDDEISRSPSTTILYTTDPATQAAVHAMFPAACGGGGGNSCETMTGGSRGNCGTGGSGTGGNGGNGGGGGG